MPYLAVRCGSGARVSLGAAVAPNSYLHCLRVQTQCAPLAPGLTLSLNYNERCVPARKHLRQPERGDSCGHRAATKPAGHDASAMRSR